MNCNDLLFRLHAVSDNTLSQEINANYSTTAAMLKNSIRINQFFPNHIILNGLNRMVNPLVLKIRKALYHQQNAGIKFMPF